MITAQQIKEITLSISIWLFTAPFWHVITIYSNEMFHLHLEYKKKYILKKKINKSLFLQGRIKIDGDKIYKQMKTMGTLQKVYRNYRLYESLVNGISNI